MGRAKLFFPFIPFAVFSCYQVPSLDNPNDPIRSGQSSWQSVATPVFSLQSGAYSCAQSISISCATAEAALYSTLDGSTPSAGNGVSYRSPIPISSSTTIKAIAMKNGLRDLAVATASYQLFLANTAVPGVTAQLVVPRLVTPTIWGTNGSLPADHFNPGGAWGMVYQPPVPWTRIASLTPGYSCYCLTWYWNDASSTQNTCALNVDAVKVGEQYLRLVGAGHANCGSSGGSDPADDVCLGAESDGIICTFTAAASVDDGKLAIFLIFGP